MLDLQLTHDITMYLLNAAVGNYNQYNIKIVCAHI